MFASSKRLPIQTTPFVFKRGVSKLKLLCLSTVAVVSSESLSHEKFRRWASFKYRVVVDSISSTVRNTVRLNSIGLSVAHKLKNISEDPT